MDEVADFGYEFVVDSGLEVVPTEVDVGLIVGRDRCEVVSEIVCGVLVEKLAQADVVASAFGEFLVFKEEKAPCGYVVWQFVFAFGESHGGEKQVVVVDDILSDEVVDLRGVPRGLAIDSLVCEVFEGG